MKSARIDTQPVFHHEQILFDKDGKKYELCGGALYNRDNGKRTYITRLSPRMAGLTMQLVFRKRYGMDVRPDLTIMELLRQVVDHVKGTGLEVKRGLYKANSMVVAVKADGFHELWETSEDMKEPMELVVSTANCRMDAVRAVAAWLDCQLDYVPPTDWLHSVDGGKPETHATESPEGMTKTMGLVVNPSPVPPAESGGEGKDVPAAVRKMLDKATGSIVNYALEQSATDMEMVTTPRSYVRTALGEADAIARKTADGHWAVYANLAGKSAEGVAFGRQAAIDLCMADLCGKLGLTENKEDE